MAKKPKYFTISDAKAEELRSKRATGGKAKVTAPKSYDPGKGRPKEHLAYLNKGEMKALRSMNGDNMERGPKNLPSFPPADAMGSSSKAGTSTGKTTTKSSNGGAGTGTGGKGNSGGPSGGMMGGSGSGGSSRTAGSNAGAGAGAGSTNKGQGPRSGTQTTKSPDTGKSAPSFSRSAPAGNSFGPRAGVDKTANTVSPSKIAQQNTLNRIASGSTVDGRNLNKFQGQVPKDPAYRSTPSQVVKMEQGPTVGPNRGLGTSLPQQTPNMFEGANSPFADPRVASYNRTLYDNPSLGTIPDSGIRKTVNNFSAPAVALSDAGVRKTVSPYSAPQAAKVFQARVAAEKPIQDRVVTINGTSYNVSPSQISSLDAADQAAVKAQLAANQVPTYTPVNTSVPRYGFTNPYSGGVAYGSQPVGSGTGVSPANTQETAAEQTVREAPVEQVGPSNPVGQWMADKVANKFNTRVSPSQQDSWLVRADQALANAFGTPGPDSAYARAMSNAANRGDERALGNISTPYYPQPAAAAAGPTTPPPPALQPLPPYVNYQNVPGSYATGVMPPSQPILDYISGGYADGGAVSSSDPAHDAAMIGMMYQMIINAQPRGELEMKNMQGIKRKIMSNAGPSAAPSGGVAPSAPSSPPPQQQAPSQPSQAVLPPPSAPISAFNQGQGAYGILNQQNQMFRLPERRGGGVGDGIDAAIRLAKSFS